MKVLITGCSRGIGLELCAQALAGKNDVLAVARNPDSAKELLSLKKKYPDHLQTFTADVTNPEAPSMIANRLKNWGALDLLINNAGVFCKDAKFEDFEESFRVNTIAPFLLTEALLPLLKKSNAPKAIAITSRMGSIADNTSGSYYAYRSSKAALNMINKSLSIDHPWLTAVVIHPGWVQTDMGGAGATLSVNDSARGIWSVIQDLSKESSGSFFDYSGKELPW